MNYLQELQITRNNLLEQLANIDTNYSLEDQELRNQVITQLSEIDHLIQSFYSAPETYYPRTRSFIPNRGFIPQTHPTPTYHPPLIAPRPATNLGSYGGFTPSNYQQPVINPQANFNPNTSPYYPQVSQPYPQHPITTPNISNPYYPNPISNHGLNQPHLGSPYSVHRKDDFASTVSGQAQATLDFFNPARAIDNLHLNRAILRFEPVYDPNTKNTTYWRGWYDYNTNQPKGDRVKITADDYYKGTGDLYRNPWDNKDYRYNLNPSRGMIGWNVYDNHGNCSNVSISPFEATRQREEAERKRREEWEGVEEMSITDANGNTTYISNPYKPADKRKPH